MSGIEMSPCFDVAREAIPESVDLMI